MWRRVFETVARPSVRPSVCPIDRSQQRLAAGLLLSAWRTGDVDRLLHGAPAAGASAQRQRRRSTGPQHGAQQHADSVVLTADV